VNEVSVSVLDLDWEEAEGYPSGTQRKVLFWSPANQAKCALLKLPAGFEMAGHSHVLAEHHYVLEGEYESLGKRYSAGHYRMIPGHTNHGPFLSHPGAVVLVIWENQS
jgi:anti-sigma factor ChrR (cupin superfamily)